MLSPRKDIESQSFVSDSEDMLSSEASRRHKLETDGNPGPRRSSVSRRSSAQTIVLIIKDRTGMKSENVWKLLVILLSTLSLAIGVCLLLPKIQSSKDVLEPFGDSVNTPVQRVKCEPSHPIPENLLKFNPRAFMVNGVEELHFPTHHRKDPWLKLLEGEPEGTEKGYPRDRPERNQLPQLVVAAFANSDGVDPVLHKRIMSLYEALKVLDRREIAVRLGMLLKPRETVESNETCRSCQDLQNSIGTHVMGYECRKLFKTLVSHKGFRTFLAYKNLRKFTKKENVWSTVVDMRDINERDVKHDHHFFIFDNKLASGFGNEYVANINIVSIYPEFGLMDNHDKHGWTAYPKNGLDNNIPAGDLMDLSDPSLADLFAPSPEEQWPHAIMTWDEDRKSWKPVPNRF